MYASALCFSKDSAEIVTQRWCRWWCSVYYYQTPWKQLLFWYYFTRQN